LVSVRGLVEGAFSIVELLDFELDFDFLSVVDRVDCAVEDADDLKGLSDLLPRSERLLLALLIGTELPELPLLPLCSLNAPSLAALSVSLSLTLPIPPLLWLLELLLESSDDLESESES